MNPTNLLCCLGLLSWILSGCFAQSDTHPEMPLLPQLDNTTIRVDSLPNTTVHSFIFSADKTKFYAIVLTASTGVFAEHTLVEFDQTGHRLRQLSMGEMSVQRTELALFQRDSLVWQFSNLFYVIDLQNFKVVDKIHTYWTGNYPDTQKDSDQSAVDEESRAWFRQKQQELGKKFDIQKTDSVTLAVLEGNKVNAETYQEAIREVRSQQTQFESDRRKTYYEGYALAQIQSAKSAFGYRSPQRNAAYVFTTFSDGRTAAFTLDKTVLPKTGAKFITCDVNSRVTIDPDNACFGFSEGQSVTDQTGSVRVTELVVTQRPGVLLNRFANEEFLFYYELKLGHQTAHFKWVLPFKLSNDFYLQSANGSAFLLKKDVLYWFHL